jgi:iron(III) transport system permease protein
MLEYALNVGANPMKTMIRITAPLIMANVLARGIISFSAAMMEASDSLVLALQQEYYLITKAIYGLNLRLGDGPYVASALGARAFKVFLSRCQEGFDRSFWIP